MDLMPQSNLMRSHLPSRRRLPCSQHWNLTAAVGLKLKASFLESLTLCHLGHINHSLFWKNLSPSNADGGNLPDGPLKKAIERDFGSVEEFKKQFNAATAAIQGSGWGWLVRHFIGCIIYIVDVGVRRATILPPTGLRSLRPPTRILYFVRRLWSRTGYPPDTFTQLIHPLSALTFGNM